MASLIRLLSLLLQLVTVALNKYSEKKTEAKYEEVRNNPTDVWVDGFGVRRETKDDSTKTNTE